VFNDLQASAEIYNEIPVSAGASRQRTCRVWPLVLPTAAIKDCSANLAADWRRSWFRRGYSASTESALRSGAGMVSLATRPEHVPAALARVPEVMRSALPQPSQLWDLLERFLVLIAGPGLGQASWGRALLSAAANAPLPQVWDADALKYAGSGFVSLPKDCVITPHPGEAARLLGISTAEVQADRPAAATGVEQ